MHVNERRPTGPKWKQIQDARNFKKVKGPQMEANPKMRVNLSRPKDINWKGDPRCT